MAVCAIGSAFAICRCVRFNVERAGNAVALMLGPMPDRTLSIRSRVVPLCSLQSEATANQVVECSGVEVNVSVHQDLNRLYPTSSRR